jgi:hypothetical protein
MPFKNLCELLLIADFVLHNFANGLSLIFLDLESHQHSSAGKYVGASHTVDDFAVDGFRDNNSHKMNWVLLSHSIETSQSLIITITVGSP